MLKIVNHNTFIKNTPLNIRQIHLFLKTICNKWYLSESLLSYKPLPYCFYHPKDCIMSRCAPKCVVIAPFRFRYAEVNLTCK
jgi:hypothetical protein